MVVSESLMQLRKADVPISGWLNPFDTKFRTKTLFQILLQSDSRTRHRVSVLVPFDSTEDTQTTGYLSQPFFID